MKTLLNFLIICFLMIGSRSIYAEENSHSKGNTGTDLNQKTQPGLKISERKSLKKPTEENISNFSMEELRSGVQRPLNEAQIQYSKSQCRYAFMSEQEIIANRCEVKAVKSK